MAMIIWMRRRGKAIAELIVAIEVLTVLANLVCGVNAPASGAVP
jgi:hypothetical protein